LCLDA
jgi:hypothetical protein